MRHNRRPHIQRTLREGWDRSWCRTTNIPTRGVRGHRRSHPDGECGAYVCISVKKRDHTKIDLPWVTHYLLWYHTLRWIELFDIRRLRDDTLRLWEVVWTLRDFPGRSPLHFLITHSVHSFFRYYFLFLISTSDSPRRPFDDSLTTFLKFRSPSF